MSTLSFLQPYSKQIYNPPPAKNEVISEFPKWLAAGIDPQKFWIPKKGGHEVIVKIYPKINIFDFEKFADATLRYSNRLKNGIAFEKKTHTIKVEDPRVNTLCFEKFTFYKDLNQYRKKYLKKLSLLQRIELEILVNQSFDLNFISPLKPLTKEAKIWMKKCRQLIPKVVAFEVDAIAAAAWVHREVVRLKPFEAQNRRLGRALGNAFLQLGGYQAIFFPNREELRVAISLDLEYYPGHLAKFYEDAMRWTILQDGLRV